MHQPVQEETVIKFYKLNTLEDIVAYQIEETETHYRIRRPLAFRVENEVITGRQMLNVREWIPPIVSSVEEINLPKSVVIFTTDVRDSFKEEFQDAVNYLYGVTPKKRPKSPEKAANVIPFASLMKDTSDKPH